ncbi:fibronectin type III domain-containing protein [Verrucomicrobiaceae bacterium E54]|nr:fibronectin type III domain-containing protein [Verrucomicrobiaceae bacterium E54]
MVGWSGAMGAEAPSAPLNLKVNDLNATSCLLTWDPPADSGGAPILSYLVLLEEVSTGIPQFWTTFDASIPVDTLFPATDYRVEVKAQNSVGTGPAAIETFTTLISGPALLNGVASDPDNGDAVFSGGDVITLSFDVPTNEPDVGSKADLDQLLQSTESLGANYTGVWTQPDRLVITIMDPGLATPFIGATWIWVRAEGNLRNAAGTSAPSTSTAVLTGNWGTFNQPPAGGTLQALPESSYSEVTLVDLDAPDWTDADGHLPLDYRFFSRATDGSTTFLNFWNSSGSWTGFLPPGDPSDAYQLTVGVLVRDALGGTTESTIQVTSARPDIGLRPETFDGMVGSVLAEGTVVATLSGEFEGAAASYEFVYGEGDSDNALFEIHETAGLLVLTCTKALDLALKNRFFLRLRVMTTSHSFERTAVLAIERGDIDQWRKAKFPDSDLSDPVEEAAIWGDEADPNGDGMPNYMHYALGLGPFDELMNFAIYHRLSPVTGLTVGCRHLDDPQLVTQAQFSDDLDWTSSPWLPATRLPDPPLDCFEVTDPAGPAPKARFGRIMLEKIP